MREIGPVLPPTGEISNIGVAGIKYNTYVGILHGL
jgi:hypothetical protein